MTDPIWKWVAVRFDPDEWTIADRCLAPRWDGQRRVLQSCRPLGTVLWVERVRRRSYGAAPRRGEGSSVLCSIPVRDAAIHQQGPDCIQVWARSLPGGDFEFMVILSCRPIQFSVCCRSFGEDNGMDFWSDDEDNEKMSRSWSSTSDESLFNCDVLWSNRKRPGHLYFEFFEVGSPYGRVPLIDKVNFWPYFHCGMDRFSYMIIALSRFMNYPRAFLDWRHWRVMTFRLLAGCQLLGMIKFMPTAYVLLKEQKLVDEIVILCSRFVNKIILLELSSLQIVL